MGQVCKALQPEYCFSMIMNMREVWDVSMRTFTALSQAVFSSVLNDLHSVRTRGLAHPWHKPAADQ